ncbi:MAG: proton-conducting transporter membrane subunit, partial [Oscillospiraceae bacterium]
YGVIIVTFRILQGNTQWANFVLIIGVLTMLIGAFFAFLSINLKETLAYSSMSQIGFITIGVAMTQLLGEHGTIAAYGTVLHMINHTLIKLVLFTCAGVIYKNTHSLNLNELKGYGRGKPFLGVCFGTASLGIMGVPFFNGYISKTLLHESIVEKIAILESGALSASMFQIVEAIFLLSGGFTVGYMIKLFICLFVKKPDREFDTQGKSYVTIKTGLVLGAVSAMIFGFGSFPHQTLDKIAATTAEFMGVHPLTDSIDYFSPANLKGAGISLVIGLLLYFVVARFTVVTKENGYVNPWNKKYSVENLVWKPLLFEILPFIFGFIGRVIDKSTEAVIYVLRRFVLPTAKIPKTFFEGKKQAEDEITPPAVSITRSLSYSLLLFGVGFIITMLYLLFSQL